MLRFTGLAPPQRVFLKLLFKNTLWGAGWIEQGKSYFKFPIILITLKPYRFGETTMRRIFVASLSISKVDLITMVQVFMAFRVVTMSSIDSSTIALYLFDNVSNPGKDDSGNGFDTSWSS